MRTSSETSGESMREKQSVSEKSPPILYLSNPATDDFSEKVSSYSRYTIFCSTIADFARQQEGERGNARNSVRTGRQKQGEPQTSRSSVPKEC